MKSVLDDFYAKTIGAGCFGQTVVEHCICVGEIVMRIAEYCCYNKVPLNLIGFICAMHDIGKLSPIFQYKIGNDSLISGLGYDKKYPYDLNESVSGRRECDKNIFKHSGAGVHYVMRCIDDRKNRKAIARIVSRHHGYSAFDGGLETRGLDLEAFCGDKDYIQNVVMEFVREMAERFNVDLNGEIAIDDADYEMISGFLSIADWIASSDFAGVHDVSSIDFDSVLSRHGFMAMEMLEKTWQSMFGFDLRDNQKDAVGMIYDYGFYLLEMGTGNGKTEIALASAYNLIRSGKCGGIYFALPTQVTSNKIFDRVERYAGNVVSGGLRAGLVHSNASQALFERGLLGNDDDRIESWMTSNRNLRLWNPLNVGTVDQLLFAVLNSKYNFIRSSSFWHKVIIIDEVHCYDSYTSELICRLKEFCLKCECVVIALSATVSDPLKRRLFRGQSSFLKDYPLLSIEDSSGFRQCPIAGNSRTMKYHVYIENNDMKAVRQAVNEAMDGKQILWIENTVKNAQRIYEMICNEPGAAAIEVGLMHSNFTPHDRLENEGHWISLLGKESMMNGERKKRGRILVATQVAEQSLDIDADKLYTRLCPIDAFAQRLGREGRFGRVNNEFDVVVLSEHSCRDYRLNPGLEWFFSYSKSEYSAFVYPPVVLYRTLECLENNRLIEYPADYRWQINQVYDGIGRISGTDEFSAKYNEAVDDFLHDERDNSAEARLNEAKFGVTRDKVDVKTRQIQDDSFSTLLIRYANGSVYTLFSGDVIDMSESLSIEDEIKIGSNLVEIKKEKALEEFGKHKDFMNVFSVRLTAMVGRDNAVEFFNDTMTGCDTAHSYSYDSRIGLKRLK